MRFFRHALRALAAACALFIAPAQAAPIVAGERALAPKAAPLPLRRLALPAPRFDLAPVAASEVESLRNANRRNAKRFLVGITRAGAATPQAGALQWQHVAGGRAAQVAVRSPEAGSLRVALDLAGMPMQMEMVFAGSGAPDRLVGPVRVGDIADRMQPWWSPITDGDTQTIEFFVPEGVASSGVPPRFTGVSHIFTTLASRFAKRTAEIGDSGSCNVDVRCSSLASSQAFIDARNAVAQMVFVDGSFTGLCTGTLLNDTDASTQSPWFYSANHCFENEALPFKSAAQMQAVANTLNTLWFFEAAACNARSVPDFSQLTGGATLIYNNPGADALFLRLADPAPAGAFFAGWDANAIAVGASVIGIHHPQGDLKKVSEGRVSRYSSPPVLGGAQAAFAEVRWSSGTTEGGSSGSGLFTFDGSRYAVRGALWGGAASCTNPGGADNFARLDQVYSALAPFLDPPASAAVDYTDLWWNPGESGWGLNLVQHSSRNIFGVWYTYAGDGKRTWYVLPGGTWIDSATFTGTLYATTGPSFDAAKFDAQRTKATQVGTATLRFTDANNGTWSYSVGGVAGTKPISRQQY